MSNPARSLLTIFSGLATLACFASAPACAQSYTFTSNGSGAYFTDSLTTGQSHAVDFFSMTSGQSAGKDATLTITGYGDKGVTYSHNGQFFYQDADLTTASILLQDAVSRTTLVSLHGPLHYEFVTSPYRIDYLTLVGTVFDAAGTAENFDFYKDEDGGTVTAHMTPAAVPELATVVDCGVLLGLTLMGMLWKGRHPRRKAGRG